VTAGRLISLSGDFLIEQLALRMKCKPAKILGIGERTLYRKIKEYNL
jgi:transcriptional regulator of acetoin/glycerol metabolism